MTDNSIYDFPLKLKYTEPAIHDKEGIFENLGDSMNSSPSKIEKNANDDWERWSLPIGNGYFGVNVFGRTEIEKFTVAEKTIGTAYLKSDNHLCGGLNTFAELYIDLFHKYEKVTDYERGLDLKTATAYVKYKYDGVTFTRECFTSYPDRALVIRLDASKEGALDFTFRPVVPWKQAYMTHEGDRCKKTGKVVSWIEESAGCIELSGNYEYYGTDFCGLFRIYTNGGTVTAATAVDAAGDDEGTIVVKGATSAYIILTLDTDYELESEVFTSPATEKPTEFRDYAYARRKVSEYLEKILKKLSSESFEEGYATLKAEHLKDYSSLFDNVRAALDFDRADLTKPTDHLLEEYKNGKLSRYLELLYFQYGRYLLIASSRKNTLPAHLQGAWNKYRQPLWISGYHHNINVQMNYWPAFSTNIAETFEAYVAFNRAYMAATKSYADEYVEKFNPSVFGKDGGNGWCIGISSGPNKVSGDRSAGNVGFTTQLFWEYYSFTQDKELLKTTVFPLLADAARYITKCVKDDGEGHFLVEYCDSPEQYVDGVWYYTTGTTYAQTFAYLNNYNTLRAAKELGINLDDASLLSTEEYSILKTVIEQIDKYDPIIVGLSGQIKEFRQEKYYGDLGEYTHRHISNLVGLYPGDLITAETPAWLDAAIVTLTERGDKATGWGVAHRLNLWARTKNGDRTYLLLQQLLNRNTAPNLWDLHPPFQIDGNLGGTAGIAEMLLQSHENYIEPIPAIPRQWFDGSFDGLLARGNFTVGATWKNGCLTEVRVKSGSGKKARIKCRNTIGVTVTDENGKTVDCKTENGVLVFDTVAGKAYILSEFSRFVKPDSVTALSLKALNEREIELSWKNASPNASFNVYKAVESEPRYTLVDRTEKTCFLYRLTSEELEKRITFAVTAIGQDMAESSRTTAYYIGKK
ncbi:MAG: glycoside hydrolase N-terminal domain-containing protein [Clostridia bacterium]|nr:glycoside hydrolase N-terminal domain-containing protein [Clostridia bacterium]